MPKLSRQHEHVAKRYIESKYPDVRGPLKVVLILVFGAGIDWGLKEAQDIIDTELKQIRIEWGIEDNGKQRA